MNTTPAEREQLMAVAPFSSARKPPGRFKSALLSWLGVPISPTDSAFWQEWSGGESYSGEYVTPDKALQNETVWACAGLIAETIATLPFGVYRRDPIKVLAPKHSLYPVLNQQPSAYMASGTFVEILVMSMLFWGNAFAEILRNSLGQVTGLNFIPPDGVSLRRLSTGALEYRWIGLDAKPRTSTEANMLHVVGRTLNGIVGLSAMAYARHVMGGVMAADKAAARMFAQGLLLQGTFETDLPIKEDKRTLFQQRLKEYQGSINAGRAPLLEGGIKYKPVSINPNDAQMLQTREFGVAQICRWFRVPPHMVGHTTNATSWGTGLEQQTQGFLTFTLQRWLKRIEDECTRKLFSPVDRMTFQAGFNFDGLLRADSAGRAAFYSTMVQNGIYTRDDCRARENLPPMGGNANVVTVQVNMSPIDDLGKAQAAAAALAIEKAKTADPANPNPAPADPGPPGP